MIARDCVTHAYVTNSMQLLAGVFLMTEIRRGQISDCADLLTIYQTTRPRDMVPKTVEVIKRQHRGPLFCRWGWLVATEGSHVVGEITFRTTECLNLGLVGVVSSLEVDTRFQRRAIGRSLVSAAESVMRDRHVKRVHVDSPADVYNYWMRLNYFAKGRLSRLHTSIEQVRYRKRPGMEVSILSASDGPPSSLQFSNISMPGHLLRTASQVFDGDQPGMVFEYRMNRVLIGVSAFTISSDKTACFNVDVNENGEPYFEDIVRHTLREARRLGSITASTVVPIEQVNRFESVTQWSSDAIDIVPMMRVL